MKRGVFACAIAAALAVALAAPGSAAARERNTPPAPFPAIRVPSEAFVPDSVRADTRMVGMYEADGEKGIIRVKSLFGDVLYIVSGAGWESVGLLDGSVYRGLLHQRDVPGVGLLVIDWKVDGAPEVLWTSSTSSAAVEKHWQRFSASPTVKDEPGPKAPRETPPSKTPPSDLPPFGEYLYVEELPEATVKVPPIYPDAAGGIEGTVMIQARVMKDGTVGETKVVKSIPELDAAAVEAVRQWRFKPATTAGQPVAVWVAVPVKFSRH